MTQHVTFIGTGIVGICCALSPQDRGISVLLIDRGEPGQETSFGNASVVSPWSIIPQAAPGIWKTLPQMLLGPKGTLSVRPSFWPRMSPWGMRFPSNSGEKTVRKVSDAMELLCRRSIDLYRRHLQGTGHEDLITDSYYVHAFRNPEQANLDGFGYLIRKEKGGDLERVEGAELQRLEPALTDSFKAALVIKGQARVTSPGRVGAVPAEKARAQGTEILRTEVAGLHRSVNGGWDLVASQEILHAHHVILAAGVWSTDLLKPLGLTVPLVAERGYHAEFPTPSASLNNSVMDVDAKIVASSMQGGGGGLQVAGTAEFASIDAPADPRKEKILTEQAKAMVPDLDTCQTKFWMGRRPSFPDSLQRLGSLIARAVPTPHSGILIAG